MNYTIEFVQTFPESNLLENPSKEDYEVSERIYSLIQDEIEYVALANKYVSVQNGQYEWRFTIAFDDIPSELVSEDLDYKTRITAAVDNILQSFDTGMVEDGAVSDYNWTVEVKDVDPSPKNRVRIVWEEE